jgi:hypothetical protein
MGCTSKHLVLGVAPSLDILHQGLTTRPEWYRILYRSVPQVDMNLYHSLGGHEKLLASATGIFKKLGALRAL